MSVLEERLPYIDKIRLGSGSHPAPSNGLVNACVMEAVAYVAGEPWSDHPECASRVLALFLIGLNDRWDDEARQLLKPFIPRLVGTRTTPADEETRRLMIVDWLVHEYAPAMFRHVGLTAEAEEFEAMVPIDDWSVWAGVRGRIREVRDAQWKRRRDAIDRLPKPVAVTDAVAEAAAAAAAAAEAVAEAAADAAAAAVTDAVAEAVAAAEAAAVADAAADAAAGFKAKVEEATAAAVASRKSGEGNDGYSAAYRVFKPYYDERYRDLFENVGVRQSVLGLIDRLIEVGR